MLDFRQACFAKRLMARPKGGNGPEEILERRGAELTERLRQSSFLKDKETPEVNQWAKYRRFPGKIEIDPNGEACRTAKR